MTEEHWENVYTKRSATEVSWHQEHARTSLELIRHANVPTYGAIVDVGGGASTLVDDLLDAGYHALTSVDLSHSAQQAARDRLGDRADQVQWLQGDITRITLPRHGYALWHDRAAFHFLVDTASREAYRAKLLDAVEPEGHVVIATFAEDGPEKCSGLPVCRYSPEQLADELGPRFHLQEQQRVEHRTPSGSTQKFQYSRFRLDQG